VDDEGSFCGVSGHAVAARCAHGNLLTGGWGLGAKEHIGGVPVTVRVRHGGDDMVLVEFRP